MKNFKTLTLSLLVIPFLFNCKGGGGEKVDPKINNNEELLSALKFENDTYIQLYETKKGSAMTHELSPNIYHKKVDAGKESVDMYSSKEDSTYYTYDYDFDTKTWTRKEDKSGSKFMDSEKLCKYCKLSALVEEGLSYEKLTYKDKVYTYILIEDETENPINFKFENKRLKYYDYPTPAGKYVFEFTYKQLTPKLPEVK